MGIPGFNKWFEANNKGAYVPLSQVQVDHVYVDLNSIMHNALRTGKTWQGFHKKLYSKLNGLLEVTSPRKTVMLAVDGPAPLAKLLTQRARRKAKGKSVKGGVDVKLSSNAITPGTRFMLDATLSLVQWVYQKLQSNRWKHLKFELSDGTVMGEGEVKILGRLARPWQQHSPEDTHIIVGDDADLVLMACVAWRDHLYVANTAMTDDRNLHKDMKVFSVDALHAAWLQRHLHASHINLPMSDAAKLLGMKMDLTLMAVISSGNDYLPGMGSINLDRMWHGYCKQRSSAAGVDLALCRIDPTTGHPHMNLKNVANMLQHVSGIGPQRSATLAKKGNAHKNGGGHKGGHTGSNGITSHGDASSNGHTVTASGIDGEEEKDCGAGHTHGHMDVLDEIEGAASNQEPDLERYLRGLLWVMHMYLTGDCPDYRFTYDLLAPSISRFVTYLHQKAVLSPEVSLASWGEVHADHRVPLLPVGCAVAMLPASSEHMLPDAAQPLMALDTSPLAELFVTCDTCDELKVKASLALTQRHTVQARVDSLSDQLAALSAKAEEGNQAQADRLAQVNTQLQQAKAELQSKMDIHRGTERARDAHKRAAHPYCPFPIARVVAAVAGIPQHLVPREEQALLRFGKPVVLGQTSDLLKSGKRLTPPPAPFANSRTYYSSSAVYSCEIAEAEGGPDAVARLLPDFQFVQQLHHAYISAPAGELTAKPVTQKGGNQYQRPQGQYQQEQQQRPQRQYQQQQQQRPGPQQQQLLQPQLLQRRPGQFMGSSPPQHAQQQAPAAVAAEEARPDGSHQLGPESGPVPKQAGLQQQQGQQQQQRQQQQGRQQQGQQQQGRGQRQFEGSSAPGGRGGRGGRGRGAPGQGAQPGRGTTYQSPPAVAVAAAVTVTVAAYQQPQQGVIAATAYQQQWQQPDQQQPYYQSEQLSVCYSGQAENANITWGVTDQTPDDWSHQGVQGQPSPRQKRGHPNDPSAPYMPPAKVGTLRVHAELLQQQQGRWAGGSGGGAGGGVGGESQARGLQGAPLLAPPPMPSASLLQTARQTMGTPPPRTSHHLRWP